METSIKQFPLCEALGLNPMTITSADGWNVLCQTEKLLAQAPVVYGMVGGLWGSGQGKQDTQSARLLCVQPLKQESEEMAVLRRMLDCMKPVCDDAFTRDTLERANALLAEKSE